jgi:protein TonB
MPLLASAAGHLALLAGILFSGAAGGPNFLDAVTVVLVGGPAASTGTKGAGTAAPAERPARTAGIRPPAARNAPPTPTAAIGSNAHPETVGPGPSPEGPAASSAANGIPRAEGASVPASGGPLSADLEGLPRDGGSPGGRRADPASAAAHPGIAGIGIGGGRDGAEIRRLRERIESRIVYPEEAIRRGQEGEVLLRIRVGEGGIPKEIRVARSSGTRALDEAARNGVARAAPLPSTPGWFEVPIRFSLR